MLTTTPRQSGETQKDVGGARMTEEIVPYGQHKSHTEIFMENFTKFVWFFGGKQKHIAKQIGISEPQLSRILNGSRQMSPEIQDIICKKLGVIFSDFINL